jgi:hypothetical protein
MQTPRDNRILAGLEHPDADYDCVFVGGQAGPGRPHEIKRIRLSV